MISKCLISPRVQLSPGGSERESERERERERGKGRNAYIARDCVTEIIRALRARGAIENSWDGL